MILNIVFVISCLEKHTGTVEDTDTGTVTAYMPDKSPAIGARVKFIPSNRTQSIALAKNNTIEAAEIITDQKGQFKVPALPDSLYNVYIELDTVKSYQKSVFINEYSHSVQSDTLLPVGSFRGKIELEPNDMHNVRSVYVQILGSDIDFVNVNENGTFEFSDLSEGQYKIKFETNLKDYSVTYANINVFSGKINIEEEPFKIIYNGIPVISNLQSHYDTANGVAIINWDSTQYKNILDFVIYRDNSESPTYSNNVYKKSKSNHLIDTIYNKDQLINLDTFPKLYEYRVAIRNNSFDIGRTFGSVNIEAISPLLVKSNVSLISSMESYKIYDTLKVHAYIKNKNRYIRSIEWYTKDGMLLKNTIYNEKNHSEVDSLSLSYKTAGYYWIRTKITDNAGSIVKDSLKVLVKNSPPIISMLHTYTSSINDSLKIKAQVTDNGNVSMYKWICNGQEIETLIPELNFKTPSTSMVLLCSLLVVDNHNESTIDSFTVRVTNALPFIDAGLDTAVGIGKTINLHPTFSDDGKHLSFQWNIDGNWKNVSGNGDTSILSPNIPGVYSYAVRVTDDDGHLQSDTKNVTVNSYEIINVQKGKYINYAIMKDADNDSDLDVYASSNYDFYLYLNNGKNKFSPIKIYSGVGEGKAFSVIDFDKDGDNDIFINKDYNNGIRWLENVGSTTYQMRVISSISPAVESQLLDYDGDGDMDVIAIYSNDNAIYAYLNDGFQNFISKKIVETNKIMTGIVCKDVNGDTIVDFVVSNNDGNEPLIIYYNNKDFTYRKYSIPNLTFTYSRFKLEDVDFDGTIDIVASNVLAGYALTIFKNNGFSDFQPLIVERRASGIQDFIIIDYDLDNDLDLVTAGNYQIPSAIYKRTSQNQFEIQNISVINPSFINNIDFDMDGDQDLIFGMDARLEIYENLNKQSK